MHSVSEQATFRRLRTIYAERRKPIVFWTGAGVSMDANLPNWDGLREKLIEQAIENLKSITGDDARRQENILSGALVNQDRWQAFQDIREIMEDTNFKEAIREIIGVADNLQPPQIINKIWSLKNVKGIVTLNIDGFTARSHKRIRTREDAASFCGKEAHEYAHIVSSQKPFIANLHGLHERASSWIFTKKRFE